MVKHIDKDIKMAVLTCGEGGSTGSQVLGQINSNTDNIEDHENRVAEIEASHTILLNCTSLALAQEPATTDTPLQVEYGAAQSTADVSMAADGALTFNTSGSYQININSHYGRTGGTGTSVLAFRLLMDGVQFGSSLAAKVDNANTLVPWSSTFIVEATAGQVLTTELIRDSTGNDSGGLFVMQPTLPAWADAACTAMQIYKV